MTSWEKSFIAAAVAIGGDADGAAAAIPADAAALDLAAQLRAPTRAARAAALAGAVHEIALAIGEAALR